MYSLSISAEGDCYRFVPPDPGIAAAALGASEFGVARSSTVLPCPAVPSSSLSGLHLPSFSTNLVSNATLQDAMVTTTTPGGSSLYTLATEPPQVAASAQVSTSGQAAASCSCRLVSHQNLLWHHRLGHPSLPRLRGMHSRLLVSGLPRSLPPLPPSPAPPCLPCVEGRQRVAPHSSSFPPTTAPLQTLHMDVGGEFSSSLMMEFCRGDGILQLFTLPDSPQQNGIAERRIGLVMETSPTLRWTGKVGDASVFRIWGSRAFVRDTSVDKLSPRAIPCVFLGFVPYAPGWRFYHPTSCRVFPSTVSSPTALPLPHIFLSSLLPGAETGGTVPGGAETGGAEPGGAEPGGVEPRGAALEGAMSEGAESGGAKPPGVASSGGSAGALPRLSPQQLREWFVRCARLRSGATGAWGARAGGAGGAGVAAGAGVTRGTATTDPGGARTRGGAGVGGPSVGGAGAGGAGALDPGGAVWPRPYFVPLLQQVLVGGLTERCEPASCPVWPVRTIRCVPHSRPPPVPSTHAMALCPSSVPLRVPLPPPPESSLPKVPDPESDRTRAASPPIARLLATAVTDPSFESAASSALVAELLDFAASCRLDYTTALVAESAEQEDFECLAAAVPRFASMLLAPEADPDARDIRTPPYNGEAITGPYSTQGQAAMDAKMASWKFTGTYIDEVPTPGANIVDGMWIFRGFDYFQTFSPTLKMTTLWVLLHVAAQRDYELHSLDFSTTFLQGSLHEEIWLRRPPGFTGTFPAGTQWSLHQPVYGLRQAPREWHDTLRTTLAALGFAPSTADPSLFLRSDTSMSPFYVLVYVDDLVFAIADTEALTLVKSELQKRHTCTDLGEQRSYLGLQITRDRARHTITLTQSHMVHQVLQCFDFQFSSPQPTPLSTSHSLSAPPWDESVESSGPYPELVGCLMYLMTCRRPDLAYPLSLLARYVAPGRHRKVHWDAAKRVLRYLCCISGMGLVLGGWGPVVLTGHADASWVDDSAMQRSSSCEAEIYAGAMAAQELRWLTYLLTDLGEQPRSPLVLYVDNNTMIALCQEHRLKHRTKHIALHYFLARELQQRGQLRVAYMASLANSADVFTKALPPGDHQRFATVLGLVPTLPHLLTA
ncbi:unnamed protein product [Closterium sp. NIES-53]